MNKRTFRTSPIALSVFLVWALGADYPAEPLGPPAPPLEGLWPSDQLMNHLLTRWAGDVSANLDLDPKQQEEMTRVWVTRWSEFLKLSRPELQPVVNEFLEMRLGPDPPSKEHVQAWSRRAMPILGGIRDELTKTGGEVRGLLNPTQRAAFEAESLKLRAGVAVGEEQLRQWSDGRIEAEQLWQPPRSQRRKRGESSDSTTGAAPQVDREADPIQKETDLWESFVADFIVRFQLDDGQRVSAQSFLTDLKARALDYRDRHREEIERLERRIRNHSGAPAELEEIKNQLTAVYGPVDDLFLELKRRLETIPTAAQRAGAEAREKSSR